MAQRGGWYMLRFQKVSRQMGQNVRFMKGINHAYFGIIVRCWPMLFGAMPPLKEHLCALQSFKCSTSTILQLNFHESMYLRYFMRDTGENLMQATYSKG